MTSELQHLKHDFLDPATIYGAVFYGVICIAVAWLAGRIVRLAVHRIIDGHAPSADQTAVRFLGDLARLVIYIIALIFYARLIPTLRELGTVSLASVGVVSVVFGIAAQNTLGNLISGISLLLYRPFQLGDRIQVNTPAGLQSGVVEALSLGYTTVRMDDDSRIVIPNSVMASQTCINISREVHHVDCVVAVNIGYDADIDKAREILTSLAKEHPKTIEVKSCRVTGFTDLGMTITLTLSCADAGAAANIKYDLLEAIKKRFDAEGIRIAHVVGNSGVVESKK